MDVGRWSNSSKVNPPLAPRRFTVGCPSTEARINVDRLDLAEGRKGRFHIETTDNVPWSACIQVPE
ncbi:hypothetical protein [Streptomyces wuyuanensis]|uniref:hypothetical protein n=1 Tax=Streptomyces wuyuanensis TaxID=1196353 RepID=UPI0037194744